jgi:predicted nucleic acid-binding protein
MLIILDSSAALRASMSSLASNDLASHELIGPPLLWSEVYSAIHEASWRRDLDDSGVTAALMGFARLGVGRRSPHRLHQEAFGLAGELGWAKTYDAEFLALAKIEGGRVLTTDARMRRGADRTGLVIEPSEL